MHVMTVCSDCVFCRDSVMHVVNVARWVSQRYIVVVITVVVLLSKLQSVTLVPSYGAAVTLYTYLPDADVTVVACAHCTP